MNLRQLECSKAERIFVSQSMKNNRTLICFSVSHILIPKRCFAA